METRNIKLYEIVYNNDSGDYFWTFAYGIGLIEIVSWYLVELKKCKNSSLMFKVKEVEYDYIHKRNLNDKTYYCCDMDPDVKYECLEGLLSNNNFNEGLFDIHYYDSVDDREYRESFYDQFLPERVINKKTLNMFEISTKGINFILLDSEKGKTKKL